MSITTTYTYVNKKVRYMSNKAKYYISSVLEQIMLVFVSGAVLQTVLLEMGLSPEMTNQFTSVQTGVQVVAITIFSIWSDRVRDLIKTYGLSSLLYLPLMVFLFLACSGAISNSIFLVFLYLTAIIYNIVYGTSNILGLKMPYQIFDMKEYGRVAGITGVVAGITAFLLSGTLTWLQTAFPYLQIIQFGIGIAIIVTLIRTSILCSLKPAHSFEMKNRPAKKFNFFKYKPFSFFILPNLLRGLSGGLLGITVSVGYYTGHLNSQSASILAVITSLVTILGCGIYALIAGRVTERAILLASSIGIFVFMPMVTMFDSTVTFLAFYGIAWFMVVFINYAVPVAVTKIADYDTMGRYSAGRMLINNAGNMLAGFLCVPLFQLIGVQLTMFLFAGLQLISGTCYYIYMKKNNIR